MSNVKLTHLLSPQSGAHRITPNREFHPIPSNQPIPTQGGQDGQGGQGQGGQGEQGGQGQGGPGEQGGQS